MSLDSLQLEGRGPNPYRPQLGTLVGVKDLATDIRMFRVALQGSGQGNGFTYQPGQFAFLSAFGVGEAPFGLASTLGRGPTLEFAVNKVGTVTSALHRLGEGDVVGVRGPFGNWFPLEEHTGKNVVLVGGGIGGAPLRPVIQTALDRRADYGRLTILWAARSPSLLIFADEYDEWRAAPDAELLQKVAPSPDNAVAILCGPLAMIKFTLLTLKELGAVLSPNRALCDACARKESTPDEFTIAEFKRVATSTPDLETCFPAQGYICLGPATRSGCGERCINGNMPCWGCFGPPDGVVDQGAKILSAIASIVDAIEAEGIDRIMEDIADPLGTFYRFGLPSSVLGRTRLQSD